MSIILNPMATFGEYIAQLRGEKGLSQRDLARKAGISPSAVSKLESGISEKLRAETIDAIARALHISASSLFDVYNGRAGAEAEPVVSDSEVKELVTRYMKWKEGEVTKERVIAPLDAAAQRFMKSGQAEMGLMDSARPHPEKVYKIPVYGPDCPAGFPGTGDTEVLDHMHVTLDSPKQEKTVFAVKVRGDSMEGAGIEDGDYLVVDQGQQPKHGDVVVACLDGEFTCKRYKILDGKHWLFPENSKYQEQQIKSKNAQVWPVLWVNRRMKR